MDTTPILDILEKGMNGGMNIVRPYIFSLFYQDWLYGIKPGWLILAGLVISLIIGGVIRRISQ